MKDTIYFSILFCFLSLSTTGNAQCGVSTNSCDTYYASNNGQRGCMFDITASQEVTILCFDANLYAGTTGNYEIYYRAGSYIGSEGNVAAWTLAGTTSGLTSAGNNLPTTIPIPIMVSIPAGQTYGFYVTNDFGAGTSYTDGTSATNVLGSDANISIIGGVGKSYPFGLTFNFREFNGTVNYNLGSPLDVSLTSFDATLNNRDVFLEWQTASETNNEFFTLERSYDGDSWTTIAQIEGQGTTTTTSNYRFTDANIDNTVAYYRLSQTDFDGTTSDYSVRAVKLNFEVSENHLPIGPNPTNDYAHIVLSKDEMDAIVITNLAGQLVDIHYEISNNGITMDVRNADPGIYIVKVGERSALLEVME